MSVSGPIATWWLAGLQHFKACRKRLYLLRQTRDFISLAYHRRR
jgi:hypothetical protein